MFYMCLKTHLWSELFEVLLFHSMLTLVRVMRYRYMYNIYLAVCVVYKASCAHVCSTWKKNHSGEFHAKFSCKIHFTWSSCMCPLHVNVMKIYFTLSDYSVPLVMVQTLITELLKITLGCDFNTVEDRLSGDTVTEEALFALHLYHRWY